MRRTTFAAAAWAALIALVLAVLAPGLSHAFPGQHGQHSIDAEMCSASGMYMTHQIVLDDAPLSSQHMLAFEHCPFCCQNGPGAFAPPARSVPPARDRQYIPSPPSLPPVPHTPVRVDGCAASRPACGLTWQPMGARPGRHCRA
ncbi:DUF2946 family protein [Massilia consociata]|uniref:DUF2946 family protein n=1 Tax=Massilia consociata TaxID=760117 RepID=A0ABV6FBB3_9BURK